MASTVSSRILVKATGVSSLFPLRIVIPRNETWHLESNPQKEGFLKVSLLPLALEYFSLCHPAVQGV